MAGPGGSGSPTAVPPVLEKQPPCVVPSTSGTSSHQDLVSVETETDNNININIAPSKSFPDNAFYHKLSPGERITLASKYMDIPELVENENTKRKKDKHEIVMEEKDKLNQSFPVHANVSNAFNDYVHVFEKPAFKALSAESKSAAAGAPSSSSESTPSAFKGTPASNKYDIKSGFQVAPTIEKYEFKTHNRAIPQNVAFDGDLAHIKSDSKTPPPSNVKLTDGEWGNLQKSASYALRAISHGSWFRDAAFNALDEALPLLDPDVPGNEQCISTLIDVKQFLIGLEYTFEKLAKYAVYPHAGVTSVLRKEFLNNESKSMLLEEQCKLFSLPYGDSLVFQGLVHTVAPQVQRYREETRASMHLENTTKMVDTLAKTKTAAGGGGGGGGSRDSRSSSRSNYQDNKGSNSSFYQTRRSGGSYSPSRQSKFTQARGGAKGGHNAQSSPKKGGGGNRNKGKGKKGK